MSSQNYFDTLVGKEIKGLYRIERKIGEGGMGAVFQATKLEDQSQVAIKIISPSLCGNQRFLKRFKREAKVGSVLSHPNIIKVFEYGETEDNMLYMVMEYIPGDTIRGYLQKNGAVSVERTLELLKPLCEAIDTAHNRNILHRDLKPENIILYNEGGKEVLKLADFGLVKLLQPDGEITKGSNLTEVGEVFGTPHFMAPEQVLGQVPGAPADVYSIGVMAYQMLTGHLPIEVDPPDVRKLLVRKVSEDIGPISKKYPNVPSHLDSVITKVLIRDPKDRYQGAAEFLEAFTNAYETSKRGGNAASAKVSSPVPVNGINSSSSPVKEHKQDIDSKTSERPASGSNMTFIIGIVVVVLVAIVLAILKFKK